MHKAYNFLRNCVSKYAQSLHCFEKLCVKICTKLTFFEKLCVKICTKLTFFWKTVSKYAQSLHFLRNCVSNLHKAYIFLRNCLSYICDFCSFLLVFKNIVLFCLSLQTSWTIYSFTRLWEETLYPGKLQS